MGTIAIISATSSIPIYAQLVWILGKLMEGIYYVFDLINIQNTGLSIIVFTIILYTLMWPLMKKQQKFTRMSSIMNPEIQKIQKKYKGKSDAESMGKMQQETNAVYKKYGMSPSGGCVVSLIQFPILFALYSVIRNLPTYVGKVEAIFTDLAAKLVNTPGAVKLMGSIAKKSPININIEKYDDKKEFMVDVLYKFQDSNWDKLLDKYPDLTNLIEQTRDGANHINNFCGLSIMESPFNAIKGAFHDGSAIGWSGALVWIIIGSILIPILAGLSQYVSAQIMNASQKKSKKKKNSQDKMQQQMNMMMKLMPLISVWMGFTLPAYLGIYWIASSIVRTVQSAIINHQIDKVPLEDLIEENKKKMEAKEERRKKKPGEENFTKYSQKSTKEIIAESDKKKKNAMSQEEKEAKLAKANELRKKAKTGSLSAGAGMVQKFNSGELDKKEIKKEENKEEKPEEIIELATENSKDRKEKKKEKKEKKKEKKEKKKEDKKKEDK